MSGGDNVVTKLSVIAGSAAADDGTGPASPGFVLPVTRHLENLFSVQEGVIADQNPRLNARK